MPKRPPTLQPTGLSFIAHDVDPNDEAQNRLLVRRHAALASASVRKATIAAKELAKTGDAAKVKASIKEEKQKRRRSQPALSSVSSLSSRNASITSESASTPSSASSVSPQEANKESVSPLSKGTTSAWNDVTFPTPINAQQQEPKEQIRCRSMQSMNEPGQDQLLPTPLSQISYPSDHLSNDVIEWHVDYYFTHLAPETPHPSYAYLPPGIYIADNMAMREQLWTMAQDNMALLCSLLHCASTHASMTTQTTTTYPTTFRLLAINAISTAVSNNGPSDDALVSAVAILALCETASAPNPATPIHLTFLHLLLSSRPEPTASAYPEPLRTLLASNGIHPTTPTTSTPNHTPTPPLLSFSPRSLDSSFPTPSRNPSSVSANNLQHP
ncbi:hypothetical protein MBLNU230_g5708t1 [Neophaeotheca triangularis]